MKSLFLFLDPVLLDTTSGLTAQRRSKLLQRIQGVSRRRNRGRPSTHEKHGIGRHSPNSKLHHVSSKRRLEAPSSFIAIWYDAAGHNRRVVALATHAGIGFKR